MSSQKLFIICGLSRLSARVARSLEAAGHRVTVIMYDGDKTSLRMILPRAATILTATAENAAATLDEAGLQDAECVLALSEDDTANLRSTVSARSIVPDIPVVMRSFDPLMAEQFERGFGVRRAYSVSSLAAPAFIASAAGAEMLGSLRLGSDVIPFCRVDVRPESPLIGKTLEVVETEHGVAVIAYRHAGGPWEPHQPEYTRAQPQRAGEKNFSARRAFGAIRGESSNEQGRLKAGDEILFGGTTRLTLALCIRAAGWYKSSAVTSEGRGHGSPSAKVKKRVVSGARKSHTYLPLMIFALLLFAANATLIFGNQLHLSLIDSIYFTVTTMVTIGDGDVDPAHFPPWLKLFQCLVMLNGGALLGVSFSYLTSLATAERLEVTMARQAERMSGHVIVVGLGNVGYRVTQAMAAFGLDMVVVDLAPPPQFYDSVTRLAPVITGDARVSDFLNRIAVTEAKAIIACTSNDVANVETCLHARRMNPNIRTVARVFDNRIVGTVASAFAIDSVLSATSIAEGAFVIAACDADAIVRLDFGGLQLTVARYLARTRIVEADIKLWQSVGIRLIAFRSKTGDTSSMLTNEITHEAVAIGPEPLLRKLLAHEIVAAD